MPREQEQVASRSARRAPRVFLSYAWEDGKHGEYRQWMQRLALALCRDGVEARIDAWHCAATRDFVSFMGAEVRLADHVLIVGSPGYRERIHAREEARGQSGAAWEALLVTGQLFQGHHEKVLVAVGHGPRADALPDFLCNRNAFELAGKDAYAEYQDLLNAILVDPTRPIEPVPAPPQAARLEPLFGAAPAAAASPDEELASYRARALARHERLTLLGLGTRLKFPLELQDLHVPMRAIVDRRLVGLADFDSIRDAEEKLRAGAAEEIELHHAFGRVDESKRSGCVLLGDPGSGKSTHLKQLLLYLLRGEDPQAIGLAPGTTPVLLLLRELDLPADLDGATPGDFDALVDQAARKLGAKVTGGFASRLREASPVLYLLDGLDEVAEARRAKVMRWIERVLADRRESQDRFVVTCRFAGYREEVQVRGGELLEMHLRPLDERQVARFALNWYLLAERSRRLPAEAERIAQEKAHGLVEKLGDPAASHTAELATNPLLLTALCVVHLEHEDGLPARRIDLYERCADVLIEHWRKGKGLAATLTRDQARALLGRAALWMHEEPERTRAAADELEAVVRAGLAEIGREDLDALELLAAVRDESGLLTGWSGTHYGFLHLGFQEHLAAAEIARRAELGDGGPLETLADSFGVSWWREVTLLFAALSTPAMLERYLARAGRVPAFGVDTDWLDWIEVEAGGLPAAPLLALVDAPAGDGEGFQRCQLAALLAAERAAPGEIPARVEALRGHPLWELRARYRVELEAVEARVDERTGVEFARIPAGDVAAFELARCPVTNEQYARFLRERPDAESPANWNDPRFAHPRQPVVGISWKGTRAYCKRYGYRLPSEAEWEHACRAGTTTAYWSGDAEEDLARVGWCEDNSGRRLHAVGERPPNPWGLFDVHGNVWEWCEDKPEQGSRFRVRCGGSWFYGAGSARLAYRSRGRPVRRYHDLGFRPARSLS